MYMARSKNTAAEIANANKHTVPKVGRIERNDNR